MRSLFKGLAGALAAGALVLGGGVAGADTPRTPEPAIDWKPCPDHATAECGTLRLPVDRARPGGETFDLAVARRKATDPDRRVGVLLVNPGGPGDSGVNYTLTRAEAQLSAELRSRFDIVGFDPRGVGGSRPVMCSKKLLDAQPSVYPRDQEEFERLAAYNRELREDCRRHTGPVFDHADTLSVVHDMEALRKALGERRINFFGHSYGTLIGEQYAELYGDRIRAMSLTANVDHSITGTREFLVSSATSAEDSWHQFVKWCDRARSCALHGRDVPAVWDELLKRADRGEIRDPEQPGRTLGANEITQRAFRMFYGPDWAEAATYVARLDAQRPELRPAAAGPETGQPLEAAPFPAVFCQDWRFRPRDHREFARLTAAERQAAPHMRGSPRVHAGLAGCVGWPERVNNPQHRLRITEAPKLLMMHSRHDPANPLSWAAEVRRQTRGTAVLLTYEGAGHRVYDRSDCTRDAMDGYLLALKVPRDGGTCAAADPATGD
ncbi:alpha/beta hydrolase [Streptomyces purpurascens]|uniref:alpha/beta hydrolase n=1 Tax=Streptomyces purpurascens TaxID=1924 RepID=UPI001999C5E4|nr:alpha/beta hydrolase [Streptomyces purpurascens]MCE7049125.1 alpha/beta hydrolase [Streptomyces purpurascens]GHA28214.1 peptidase [Streptomyces purpurascens]